MNRNIATMAAGCALALSICGTGANGAAATRDWKAHPAVVETDTSEDIFAIGDPHADPQRLAAVLAGAKLIAPGPVGCRNRQATGRMGCRR